MKRKIWLVLLMMLFCPIITRAKVLGSYEEVNNYKTKYTESLKDYDLYFITKGELLTANEYSISGNTNSYLFDGQDYWMKDNASVMGESSVGVRIVETVRKNSEVSGAGSYSLPWSITEVSREAIVSFVSNVTGSVVNPTSKKVSFGSSYGSLASVQKTGYTFNGWFTESTGGTEVKDTTQVNIIGNHTLYAHQSIKQYTLNIAKQTGVASAVITGCTSVTEGSKYTCNYGASVKVTATAATNYQLINQIIGSNIANQTLNTAFTMPDISGEATLTIQAKLNQFDLTYNSNGGSACASKKVTYGVAYGALCAPTRSGYTFAGWYTAASGGTVVNATTIVSTAANHTIYAHWTANSYILTYVGNGGSTPAQKNVYYDSAYGTLASSTRAGYTFAGWYTAASGGTQVTAATVCKGNATIYAHWNPIYYSVSWASITSGTGSAATSTTYGGSASITLSAASGYNLTAVSYSCSGSHGAVSYNNAGTLTVAGVTSNVACTITLKSPQWVCTINGISSSSSDMGTACSNACHAWADNYGPGSCPYISSIGVISGLSFTGCFCSEIKNDPYYGPCNGWPCWKLDCENNYQVLCNYQ